MRFFQIASVLSKHLVFYKFTSQQRGVFGRRLKLAFEELGITFIKIGQILSMRYDLLSPGDCTELQELLDNVSPVPYDQIVRVIERDYGRPWTEVFKNIDPRPLGSASVSQVHKAETHDGSAVAIKVKRPQVDRTFSADIGILKRLAGLAEVFSPTLRYVQARDLVSQFEKWIRQDLDFALEVRNIKKIKEQYRFVETGFRPDLGRGVFPKAFESLCTENIIVMDYIDGVPLTRKHEIAGDPRYDIEKSVKTYVNTAIRNCFDHSHDSYVFQADPHMSNILILPNGDAASVDFGLIAEMPLREAVTMQDMIMAVYLKDLDKLVRIACELGAVSPEKYAAILRPDFEAFLNRAHEETFGFWFFEVTKILLKHRLKFPLWLATFGRTAIMLDGLVAAFLPGQTTLDILGREFRRQAILQVTRNVLDLDWLKVAYVLSEKIQDTPEIIAEFIDSPLRVISKLSQAVKTTT